MSTKVLLRLLSLAVLLSVSAFAVDGVVLINQASVMAAGGFPYRIMNPGSYKLSGNLVVPANVDGVDISADNVALDLNGFTITGNGGGSAIFSRNSGITVKNGAVVNFGIGIALGETGWWRKCTSRTSRRLA